ncbi:NAD(P)-dependent oxidoreductase [Rhodococcus koreensis]|uniref:NAD(P)-dependent oxidoreductase n=1 Tax=Rhodococcus koreensis TaxID=99653 RepID=UPI00366E93BD
MKVGFIGLGQMGRGMASNLQKAGFDLVVTELTREVASVFLDGGAVWADTPREVAEACEVLFTSLPTPADVEAIAAGPDGLKAGLARGAAWFDLSTNAVDVVRRLQSELATAGIDFLDAPVSGGPAGAASGDLAIWVGGDQAAFDRHRKLLDAMSDKASYIGPIGAGTIAKLVHNMASAAVNAVVGEVLTMGVKAGLEPLPLWQAIRQGAAGRARMFDGVSKRFLQGKLDPPSFQLRLLHKDVGLALRLGGEVDVPMPLCDVVFEEITEAVQRGWGGRDAQTYLLLQQERAEVPPFALTAEQVDAVLERT